MRSFLQLGACTVCSYIASKTLFVHKGTSVKKTINDRMVTTAQVSLKGT